MNGGGFWPFDETDMDEISRYIEMTKYKEELRRKGYSQAEINAKVQSLDNAKREADAAQRCYEEWEAWGNRDRPIDD